MQDVVFKYFCDDEKHTGNDEEEVEEVEFFTTLSLRRGAGGEVRYSVSASIE